jgi:hypothetical protein
MIVLILTIILFYIYIYISFSDYVVEDATRKFGRYFGSKTASDVYCDLLDLLFAHFPPYICEIFFACFYEKSIVKFKYYYP